MAASTLLASTIAAAPFTLVASTRAPECCVVVADGATARIFSAKPAAGSAACLIEHADVIAAQTLTRDRDFADAIVAEVCDLVALKGLGKVVLVGPPPTLGLLREPLQQALGGRVTVMALARDYTDLSSEQLAEVLDLS